MQPRDLSVSSLDLLDQPGVLRSQLSLGLEQLVDLLLEFLGPLLSALQLLLPDLLLLTVRALVTVHGRASHHIATHLELLPITFTREDLLNF